MMSELERLKERIELANEKKAIEEAKKAAKRAEWEAKYARVGSFRRSLMEVDRDWFGY